MKTHYLQQRIGRVISSKGKQYLYFSGTSYLGIDEIPEYDKVLLENIKRWGFNHGLSRVNNIRLSIFDEFEEFFANGAGAEASAVVSSGYLAGISAWQYLFPKSDHCWIAPDTHPAILPQKLKPDFQLNFTQWKNQCLQLSESTFGKKILLLGNAVDPLKSEIHDYSWVNELANKNEVTLLIDDSHAFGVLGESVFGTYSKHLNSRINLVISGSLGKGLAMPAGIILAKKEVISGIKAQPIFIGASPSSPSNLKTFMEAIEIYLQQSQKIRSLSQQFHKKTCDLSTIHGSPSFPVFPYEIPSWAEKLESKGFITSSFSYPNPDSPRINRIVLSGFHSQNDLDELVNCLNLISNEE